MDRRAALRLVLRGPVARRSLAVALVVGTALNAINQGAELWHGQPVVVWRLALTYCVPFLVASYDAYAAMRSR